MATKLSGAAMTIGETIANSLRSVFGGSSGAVDALGAEIGRLNDRQKELNRTIAQAGKNGVKGGSLAAGYASAELDDVNRKLESLRQKQERINAARKGAAAGQAKMGSSVLAGGLKTAGLAIGAPLAAASQQAGEFEHQLRMIGNSAEFTAADVTKLRASVLATSSATGQSAQAAAQGFEVLVGAGMNMNAASETMRQVGLAATASGADIGDLARLAFTLNDSFKVAAGADMMSALDTLSQAGKEGNVELGDMAKHLPQLGSAFSAMNLQGREAAATMGAAFEVARKGAGSTDEAADNMKGFLDSVLSPDTLERAKKGLNLDLYSIIQQAQTHGGNPFDAAMQAIMQATAGDQQKIGELFQNTQAQNFLRPMIQNWDEYARIKDKSLKANGVVDKDAENIRNTQQQQINEATNAVGRLQLAIGGALAPAVGNVALQLVPVVDTLAKFVTEHKDAVLWVGQTIATVGGMVVAIDNVRRVLGAVQFAWNTLKLAMTANPMGLALAAIAVGAVLIWQNWEPIKQFFSDLWSGLKSGAEAAWQFFSDAFFNFSPVGLVIKNWEPIKTFFSDLWADVKDGADKALQWIMDKLGRIGEMWGQAKSFLGFGDKPAPQPSGAAPALPQPSIAGGAGGVQLTDNSQNTIQIVQRPGENSDDLLSRLDSYLRDRENKQRRGAFYDQALGY